MWEVRLWLLLCLTLDHLLLHRHHRINMALDFSMALFSLVFVQMGLFLGACIVLLNLRSHATCRLLSRILVG
jgi:hypothetical protein